MQDTTDTDLHIDYMWHLYWVVPVTMFALGALCYHYVMSLKMTSFKLINPFKKFIVPGDNEQSLNNFNIKQIKVTEIDNTKKYKYGGFIAYAVDRYKPYFLLGREAIVANWSESGKWSDFGGAPNLDENPLEAIIREGFEETMGILGCTHTLEQLVVKNGTFFEIATPTGFALICMLPIKYDKNLPVHYNNIHKYLAKCAKPHSKWKDFMTIPSCPEGYYEKIELKWVSVNDIEKHINPSPYLSDEIVLRESFLNTLRSIWSLNPTLNLSI